MEKIYFTGLFIVLAFIGFSQTVSLTPAKDNSMYSENLNSSGIGQLFSGTTCSTNARRALLQFDLSSVPISATIISVTLTLNVNNVSPGAGTDTYNLYALTTDFGEGLSNGGGTGATAVAPDANWVDAMLGTFVWTAPGGDFIPTVLSSVTMLPLTGNQVFPTSINLVAAVQSWLTTPTTNFGMILIGNELATCTARRFGSKDLGIAPILVVTYSVPPCTTPPTTICQSFTTYVDASGNATITATDLDGGSIDNCGTPGLTFAASQTTFTCADVSGGGSGAPLMISGLYDGPLPGGNPKGIELLATIAIADLSNYGVGSANNGGGTDGEEFTFPAVSVTAGTYIYVTNDSTGFNNFFGFNADYTSGAMLINGDDAVELFQGGAVIDVFGDINVDGTGQPWEYLDGWAYRVNLQTANGGVFNSSNWTYSGPNALDGELTNGTAATPFPIATFIAGAAGTIPVTLVVTDGNFNVDSCVAQVTVLDTLGPVPDVVSLSDVTAECQVTSLTGQSATDNCDGATNGTNDAIFPITAQGTTSVTWTYADSHGNTTIQTQNVVITDVTNPVPDVASLTDLSDNCEVVAPTSPTAMDNCTGALTGTPDVTFPISTLGTTVVTWTYDDGNGNTVTQTQNVIINGLDVTTLETGGTITATATGLVYQWIDCSDNSLVAGETSQTFTPTVTGDYAVIITDGNCSDTSACTNVIVNGLGEIGIDLGITIAPNPSAGKFSVTFNENINAKISIYDSKGGLVRSYELVQENSLEINIDEAKAGVYLMKIQTSEGIATSRLIKQ